MKIDCEAATNYSENRLVLGFSSCLSRTGLAQVTSILLPLIMVSVIQQSCLNVWQQLKQYNILRLAANMATSASCLVLKWTNAKSLIILSLVTWPSEYALKTFRNSCSVVVIDKLRTYRTVTSKAQYEKLGLNIVNTLKLGQKIPLTWSHLQPQILAGPNQQQFLFPTAKLGQESTFDEPWKQNDGCRSPQTRNHGSCSCQQLNCQKWGDIMTMMDTQHFIEQLTCRQ